MINQWTGTGFIGPRWGTPSSQIASPAKNVQVVPSHVVDSLFKSAVSRGVTKNPSSPFHHPRNVSLSLFNFCFGLLVAQYKNMIYWMMTEEETRMSYFSTGICLSKHIAKQVWPVDQTGMTCWQLDRLSRRGKSSNKLTSGDKISSCDVGLL